MTSKRKKEKAAWFDLVEKTIGDPNDPQGNPDQIIVDSSYLSVEFYNARRERLCSVVTGIAKREANTGAALKKGFELLDKNSDEGALDSVSSVLIPELDTEMSIEEARELVL